MSYKVIQFATGNVGRLALQGILEHPDLELVGVWVHSPDKAGRDAGELCGRAPTGVLATNDLDAILALTLSGFCARVDSIRVSEILNYDTYDQATVLFDTMGFGQPMDHVPFLLMPGVLAYAWGSVIHLMAEGLGVEVDEIRERYERV